jgi:prepilin-type N-terminal cleavage/methylation domain-containing protein
MTGRSHHRGIRTGAHAADQSGFTLIELLAAMLISIIVIGGGTWGMARAFRSSSESSSRTAATNQAEVRFAVLTRDLRQVVTCPPGFTGGANSTFNSIYLGAVSNLSYSNQFVLQMCDPAPGLPQAAGSQLPQKAFVTWTCVTATESCTRQVQNISGNSVTGAATTTNTITGVVSLTLTGLVQGYNASTQLWTIDTLGTGNFTPTDNYQLNPPTSSDTIFWLQWVGITAQIASLRAPDSTSNLTQATGTAPVAFQTGVTLRNAIS